MHNPIYGVSIGAGDPDLITVKAFNILQKSDVIFYPGSQQKSSTESFSYGILKKLIPTQKDKLQGFFLKMTNDRQQAINVYEETAQKIIAAHKKDKKIAVVCEGDLQFFGSFCYLMPIFKKEIIPFEIIPGISAMQMASAAHQIPLGLWDEKIAVLPKIATVAKLTATAENFETVVLLKIKPIWEKLRLFLQNNAKKWAVYYAEKIGTTDEKIINTAENLPKRVPYFSLLILKKKRDDTSCRHWSGRP